MALHPLYLVCVFPRCALYRETQAENWGLGKMGVRVRERLALLFQTTSRMRPEVLLDP